jgi:prephenate dehydrogenase
VPWIAAHADEFAPSAVVVDSCGVKREICEALSGIAAGRKWHFVGGHPMAGKEVSGFANSDENLFKGASMIIVPPVFDDMELLERVKEVLAPLEFKQLVVSTAENHDAMIAYTSQLCHVVSNALVKSPTAQKHHGYSAGSFRDLTRVARLNENMWTELFLANKEPLLGELDRIINSLQQYRDALDKEDAQTLCSLLRDGRIAKEQSEG